MNGKKTYKVEMTLYKNVKGKIERIYYVYVKNGYEIDFVTAGINDERVNELPVVKKIINSLADIKIYDDEKDFVNMFLDYPFLHIDEFVRYTYYIRSDSEKDNEQMAIFNTDLIKAALGISNKEEFNEEVFKKAIIDSAVRISNYNLDSNMFELIKEKKHYNLYLIVGEKRFIISKLDIIKPNYPCEELRYIYYFPFKYEDSLKGEVLTNEVDRNENILFFAPKYIDKSEKKIKKSISKEFDYAKRNYILLKLKTSIWGNYYLPCKSLKK